MIEVSKSICIFLQFENLRWLDCYIDRVEHGESPTFDQFYKWGAFGSTDEHEYFVGEKEVHVSLPALDTQIEMLLKSTEKLLVALSSVSAFKYGDEFLTEINQTDEQGECHPFCPRRWNNRH